MTQDNITDLGSYKAKKSEMVWECKCGDQLFYLLQDSGGARCRTCGKIVWFAIGDNREELE
jgi:hypothetical protein